MSSKPDTGRSKGQNAPTKKDAAEPANGEKIPQQAEQEVVRERRNGYQMISTATYYRTERRGLSGFDQVQDQPEANVEIDATPGADGASGPYGEGELDR
ncbi:hypothetical protein SAMN05216420_11525 [Nitrosospira sp. Nl5]|uniref:hypothetical protein n=1 Tax=Nitrosospira sp. Nl5 TaxID=200120 RepID=UPI00088E3F6F|nr:hypothetical protein [Nitrosospira sp. Nl5]SCY73043.1 hypothetical protein SAMN05216420_11525 [Nitrosospira sp. Nl5]